jgi:hypothetical protein
MVKNPMAHAEDHYRETAKKILTTSVRMNTSMGPRTMSLMEADHLVANGHADARDLHKGFAAAVNMHHNPDAAAAAAAPKAKKPRQTTAKMLAAQAISRAVLQRVHAKLKIQGCDIRRLMHDEWAAEQKRAPKYLQAAAQVAPAVQSGEITPGEAVQEIVVEASPSTPPAPRPTGGKGAGRPRKKGGESAQAALPLSGAAKKNRGRRNRRNPGIFSVVENDGKFHLTGPGGQPMGKYYMSREKANLEAAKMNERM